MMTPEEALTEVKARLRAARIQRLVTGMRSAIYRLSRDLNYDLGHALLGGKVLEEGWMEPVTGTCTWSQTGRSFLFSAFILRVSFSPGKTFCLLRAE